MVPPRVKAVFEKAEELVRAGALHIMVGNFATKFVSFFASIFIVQILSKEDYGTLGYMENLAGYLYLLLGLGLAQSILRYVVVKDDEGGKLACYRFAVRRGNVINAGIVVVALVACLLYPFPEEFAGAKLLMPLLLLALPFHYLTDCQTFLMRALFKNKAFAVASFLLATALIYGKFAMAWTGGLFGAVLSQPLIYFAGCVVLAVAIRKSCFVGVKASPLDASTRREMHGYSLQYMVTNGVWSMFMLNDVFLLGLLVADPSVVADYKVAYVLPANLSILCSSIGVFVAPYFIKHEKDSRWVWSNFKKVLLVSTAIMGAAVVVLGVFAEPVIVLLYGGQYAGTADLMRLLLVGSFVNSALRYTVANLLAAMGQIKYNMVVSIMGVVLQLTVNFLTVPLFGAYGLAFTSIGIYAAMSAVLMVVFAKKYRCGLAD